MRPTGEQIDKLMTRLIQAESSGNEKAVGDNGKARGLMQIQEPAWKEVSDEPYDNAFLGDHNVQAGRAILERIAERYGNSGSIPKIAYTYNTGRYAQSSLPSWTQKHPNKIYRDIFNEKD